MKTQLYSGTMGQRSRQRQGPTSYNNQTSQTSFLLLRLLSSWLCALVRTRETHLSIRVCSFHVFVSLHVYHLAPGLAAAKNVCVAILQGRCIWISNHCPPSLSGSTMGRWGAAAVGSAIEQLTFRRRRHNDNVNTRNVAS